MPQALPIIGAIGAGAAVVGTAMSYTQGRKVQKSQEQQQEVASRRERMQAIRETQVRRAQAVMTSVGAGSQESSAAEGGIGSLSSQLGTQMGYGSQMTGISRDISAASGRQSMWGAVGSLGMTAFNGAGGFNNPMFAGGGQQANPFQGQGYQVPRPLPNPFNR